MKVLSNKKHHSVFSVAVWTSTTFQEMSFFKGSFFPLAFIPEWLEVQNIYDYRLHHVFWGKGNKFLFCLAWNAILSCSVKLLCFDRLVCHQGHISMSALRFWTWLGNETGIPKQCQVQWGALWTSRRFLFILQLSSALLRLFISGIFFPYLFGFCQHVFALSLSECL